MCSCVEIECSRRAVPDVVEKPYGLYPGLEAFSADYDAGDYGSWIEQSNGDPLPAPLAIYIQDVCHGQSPPVRGADISSSRRLRAIEQELILQGASFDSDRPLQQLRITGAMTTQWTDDQLYRLISVVRDSFTINQSGIANWCACMGSAAFPSQSRLRLLRVLGFSSVRLAYSDDAYSDSALDEIASGISQARRLGIHQIVLDLILHQQQMHTPIQDLEAFLSEVGPDRVRLVCGHENRTQSMCRLLSVLGYQNIGLDWFLHSDDIWLQAKAAGLLRWSPLGYTDLPNPDVIGVGPGAISSVGEFYAVNECRWQPYEALVMRRKIPVVRGIELEADDVLRREIMGMILSAACIRVAAIEEKWGIQFRTFFAHELEHLREFEQKNWLEWQADTIRIRAQGYRQLTELCRLFDHRARRPLSRPSLSFV